MGSKRSFRRFASRKDLNKPKHGFDVPVGEWFKKELRDVLEDTCGETAIRRRGLFDPKTVRRLMNDHFTGKRELNNQLWILLSLEWWQRLYLDRNFPEFPTS